MYTLKVGNAEQYLDIEQNETRLRVPFQILDGETVVLERNESFPLTTSQEEITATLKRHLTVVTDEKAREEESKERQAAHDNAEAVAGSISNLVIE